MNSLTVTDIKDIMDATRGSPMAGAIFRTLIKFIAFCVYVRMFMSLIELTGVDSSIAQFLISVFAIACVWCLAELLLQPSTPRIHDAHQ